MIHTHFGYVEIVYYNGYLDHFYGLVQDCCIFYSQRTKDTAVLHWAIDFLSCLYITE